MIRTVVAVVALIIAVLFMPLWIQLVLFAVAVWVLPYRLPLLLPAVLADVLYQPTGDLSINVLTMTLVVAVLILLRWLLLTQTRFGSFLYGVETY
jgi:hypothetical protein